MKYAKMSEKHGAMLIICANAEELLSGTEAMGEDSTTQAEIAIEGVNAAADVCVDAGISFSENASFQYWNGGWGMKLPGYRDVVWDSAGDNDALLAKTRHSLGQLCERAHDAMRQAINKAIQAAIDAGEIEADTVQ